MPNNSHNIKLEQRYSIKKKKISKKSLLIIASTVVTIVLLFLGRLAFFPETQTIQAKTISYNTVDNQHVIVAFEFNNPSEKTVHCSIEALDNAHTVVGWKENDYRPDNRVERHEVKLRTESAAVTGQVKECWIPQ